MTNKQIVVNRIRTPDGTILTSRHVHDYVTHTDTNGEEYMVDGGNDYLRRNVCEAPYEEISLYADDPHEGLRKYLEWGTYGVEGDQPLKWVALEDMSSDHIINVLKNVNFLAMWRVDIMKYELKFREL